MRVQLSSTFLNLIYFCRNFFCGSNGEFLNFGILMEYDEFSKEVLHLSAHAIPYTSGILFGAVCFAGNINGHRIVINQFDCLIL